MVESAAASNPPPALQARPPTPPRESNNNGAKPGIFSFVGGRFFQVDPSYRRASAPATASAPVESSVQTPGSGKSTKKKVLWSESAEYRDPPAVSFDGKNIRHTVQPLAPSSERKPTKSILKAYNGVYEQECNGVGSGTKLLPLHHHATFATMLDSIVQQLARKDRSSKMDAYLMLSSSLKASDNVPDPKALKGKMGLLCQFIGQDLSQKLENGKADTGLVVNALVLLSSFLQKPAITETFPAEFPIQLVEHAIKAFEDESTSKEIVKHLMFMMAQQNFPPKVMNQERVGRLITALHNIENHTKGKSIAMSRINISRTLLRQSRSHMMTNTIWVQDMFNDMLSSLKEIRTLAITFGFEAAITLGIESTATRVVTSLFKLDAGEKGHFADFYAGRLKVMVKNKEDWDSAAVPQIWSVIMLFLRSKPQTLEQWQFLNLFLEVIQLCFNSSDIPTRTEANFAWNRFIFAVQPSERSPPKLRAMVSQALLTQLKSRKSQSARKVSLSSINILLYYALKPQSTPAQLDLFWDEYVIPLIKACLNSAKERDGPEVAKQEANDACFILQCLFDSTTQRKWTETRAIDSLQHNNMDPTELPALDSKWLRKNHERVFKVLVPLMEKLYWDLGSNSPATRLWKTYIASIASPAVMEVKVSIDTMSCIASIFSMLHKFWNMGGDKLGSLPPSNAFPSAEKTLAFLGSFESIVSTTIDGLGVLPFTEKLLSIAQDGFIAVATPSQQPRKIRIEVKSPLHHLVLLLLNPSPGMDYKQPFLHMVHRILTTFVEARPSKRSQVDLIHNLIHLLATESSEPSRQIWQVLADLATTATDTREDKESSGNDDQPLISDYRHVVKILETGVHLSPNGPISGWKTLFEAVVTSATLDAGDAGRAIAVIEPLAKFFAPQTPTAETKSKGLFYLSPLLGKATYPKDRHAFDAATRKLWGISNTNQKPATFDPYVQLYEYIKVTLETAYNSFSKDNSREYADAISAVTNILGRCPTSLLLLVLAKIQPGIEPWIVDGDSRLVGGDALAKGITSLWAIVKKLMSRLLEQHSYSRVLNDLESLICAGLNSKHKTLLNGTIKFWNTTFGSCKEELEYPDRVKDVLLRLRPIADLQLPFFPDSIDEEPSADQRQPMDYEDSQEESFSFSGFPSDSAIMRGVRSSTPQVVIEVGRSMSLKRSRENTPDSSRRKSRKRNVTPRIRHDDSQVQFEAIESSPMADRIVDSQLLTDKQKETKERQQAVQAMFPDLRSTPIPREKSVPKEFEMELPIHRSSSQLRTRAEAERETTPILAIPSDDDGFVASSPTPTRSLRGEPEIVDPPSSPPEAAAKSVHYRSPYNAPDRRAASPSPERTPQPTKESTASLESIDIAEPETVKIVDEDIPSSPPEMTPQPDETVMDLDPTADIDEERLELPELEPSSNAVPQPTNETVSFGQSAQVDPFGFTNITMSSVEFTPVERHSSPVEDDPSEQLRASQREEALKLNQTEEMSPEPGPESLEEDQANYAANGQDLHTTAPTIQSSLEPVAVLPMAPLFDPKPPGTPVRNPASSPIGQKTPQFVDAQSSPASSDKQIFEDAVSSPRLMLGRVKSAQIPSTPDEFGNDSSFVRMMADYDEPGQVERHVSFAGAKENPPRRSMRASVTKGVTEILPYSNPTPAPTRRSPMKKTTNLQATVDKEPVSSISEKSSSMPSLIPETPGVKTVAMPIIGDDGLEYDEEDTIVVDTSSLEEYQPTVRKAGRRKGWAKKRKHHEVGGDSNEVPDSQDAMAGMETTTRRSPSKKKQKGFSKRGSQVEQREAESSQDLQSQGMSVDLDAPIPELEIDGTTSVVSSAGQGKEVQVPAKELEIDQTFEESFLSVQPEPEVAQSFASIEQLEPKVEETLAEEGVDMDTPGSEEANGPDVDVIEETRIEIEETRIEESSLGSSSAAKPEIDLDEEIAHHTSPEIEMAESPSAEPVDERDPAAEPEIEPAALVEEESTVTVESMAHKLQSLMVDLQTASLSRQDASRLEDLFFDAKRQLYDAAHRGRQSADR